MHTVNADCSIFVPSAHRSGARKMYGSFVRYVSGFAPEFCGIDVQKLLDDMETCFRELLDVSSGYPHGIELRPELIPSIQHEIP